MSNTSLLGSYGDNSGAGLMFRNRIINGGFDVWQRGTSQTAGGYGSDDRWFNDHNGSTKTHSQQAFTLGQTDVPGNPRFFSRTVVSSVAGDGNYVLKDHRIEDVRTFAGQTATLSFWAKADAPKNMAVEFRQFFGSDGSPSAVVNLPPVTIALTTSWRYYTVTANIPSIAGKVLGTSGTDNFVCRFWFEAGSNFNARTNSLGQQSGTFDIANVQLEAGPVATPFERRPIGVELGMCQRYCYVSSNNIQSAGSATVATGWIITYVEQFPVVMRAIPTEVGTSNITFELANNTGAPVATATINPTPYGVSAARFEHTPSTACAYFRGPSRARIYSAEL